MPRSWTQYSAQLVPVAASAQLTVSGCVSSAAQTAAPRSWARCSVRLGPAEASVRWAVFGCMSPAAQAVCRSPDTYAEADSASAAAWDEPWLVPRPGQRGATLPGTSFDGSPSGRHAPAQRQAAPHTRRASPFHTRRPPPPQSHGRLRAADFPMTFVPLPCAAAWPSPPVTPLPRR